MAILGKEKERSIHEYENESSTKATQGRLGMVERDIQSVLEVRVKSGVRHLHSDALAKMASGWDFSIHVPGHEWRTH